MKNRFSYLIIFFIALLMWGTAGTLLFKASYQVPSIIRVKRKLEKIFQVANTQSLSFLAEYQNPVDKDPNLCLPKHLGSVVGETFSLYYDCMISGRDLDAFLVSVSCDTLPGLTERHRWTITPKEENIGRHQLEITVSNGLDQILFHKIVMLDIVPATLPNREINILLVGDCLTKSCVYPNHLFKRLQELSTEGVHFLGEQHPPQALPEVFLEGQGGWDWKLFATHYKPGEEEYYSVAKSPFVCLKKGRPKLDVAEYIKRHEMGQKLDVIIFMMGLNSTFELDKGRLEKGLDETLAYADALIDGFRKAVPNALIGIVVPQRFNRGRYAFEKNYQSLGSDFFDPWRHQQIQHRLAQKMCERYDGLDSHIFLIPMNVAINPLEDYPIDNAAHPHQKGAEHMADVIFTSIVWAMNDGYGSNDSFVISKE